MTEFEDQALGHDDDEAGWDAFWAETLRAEAAERGIAPTETIRGVTVRVPQDIPLRYEAKAKALKDRGDDAAFAALIAEMFQVGEDVLEIWRERGMGARELRTVLAWGISHGKGKPISFREAYQLVMRAAREEGEDETGGGKARKRSTRASGRSASTGR